MKQYLLLLILFVLFSSSLILFSQSDYFILESKESENIVIPALKNDTSVPNICIIFLQGALIGAQYYRQPLYKIQSDLNPQYQVWIGIPQFTGSLVDPLTSQQKVEEVKNSLFALGMPQNVKYFLAGHSLGGAQVSDFTKKNPYFSGQMLWGATLNTSDLVSVQIPTLQLGGELDGLTPIMRMTLSFYFNILNPLPSQPKQNFPVIVIPGMNHIEFTSAPPNAWIKRMDLKASISTEQAHIQIGLINSYFISQIISGETNTSLSEQVNKTAILVQPLIDSLLLEGSYHLKPPCYDNPPSEQCWTGCPWTQTYSQQIMSGFNLKTANTTVSDVDGFHPVYQTNPVHLPKVLNNCVDPEGCVLQMQTVTQAVYGNITEYISASELRTKMTSRQRSYIKAGYIDADFNVTDAPQICAEINNASYTWALEHAGEQNLQRFLRFGEPYVMGPDLGPFNAGPEWIWYPLQYKDEGTTEQPYVEIQSPMMKTPNKYIVPQAAGFHYCKVLSPARAMEWIYTAGLRAHMGLK